MLIKVSLQDDVQVWSMTPGSLSLLLCEFQDFVQIGIESK